MNLILSLKTLNLCYPECLLTPQWWENDHENEEGKLFEPITSELGLQQLICEPTHFIGESKSCIDLILINQSNLFLETGAHPSLHEQCHHHIVFAKITADNLALPPYNRKIWFYDQANIPAIRRSIELYRWQETFQELQCLNLQLNEVLINIFSNFIPNTTKTVRPRQAPSITKSIKNFTRKKNRAYKNLFKNGRLWEINVIPILGH